MCKRLVTMVIESDASVVRKCCSSPKPHELPGRNTPSLLTPKRFCSVDNISVWLAQKAWKANMKPEKLVLFFHVGHSVTVPATGRLCNSGFATDHHTLLLLFSSMNEVLVQRDLMWYWKATAVYKTDAYILRKLLGEKVAMPLATSLCSVRRSPPLHRSSCSRLNSTVSFYVILHVSRFQILCQLQFCLSSTSCAVQFPKWSPSILQDIYAMACGTPFLRRAESCLPDNRECPTQVLWKIPWLGA